MMRIFGMFQAAPAVVRFGAVAALCLVVSSHAKGAELPVGPDVGDMALSPFYRWSGPVPDTPGTLLKQEAMAGQEDMPAASAAIRILYSSRDERWGSGPIPVSGTLFLPAGEPPAGGWPLLAWAHGTLGIADSCAPSWAGFRSRDASYLNRWLAQGFAVVATDYQGLGGPGPHPYSYWQAEGRSVLDSIRAAQTVAPGALSGRTLLAGQSQGGGAALGAATLADTHARDLDIRGAVITGPNSTFPEGPIALPRRHSLTMFLGFATGALKDGAPPMEGILSLKGRTLLGVARQGCTGDIARKARELEVGSFEDLLAISPQELASLRVPTTDMPLSSIRFPLLIATGKADRTITPMEQYAVAAALCAAGNQVTWRLLEGMGHDGAMHGSLDEAFAFARARLDGRPVGSNCSDLQPPGPPGERDPQAPFNDD